jgi:uncharacterized membrane protein YphA (DoxX/SURF4 family)
MTRSRIQTIAYWLTTLMGPASFVIGGTLYLTGDPQALAAFEHLGYPAYFAYILGIAKLLGAITVVLPGLPLLKEWAYAGFFFTLIGAAASHALAGDSFLAHSVPPLFFLALTLASWALRPDSRRLPGTRLALSLAPRRQVATAS